MKITINGATYVGTTGQTILQIATDNNIYIPTLCHSASLPVTGACAICVVEVAGVARLVRACGTPVTDGMEIFTESEKVLTARKTVLELMLSDHSGDCKAPCQLACPAGTNCQGYISLIAEGKMDEAVALMYEAHPFPASVARICPRPCEQKCHRKTVDEAVNIAGLKRFATDNAANYKPVLQPDTNKKVAIIGGGPGGLTAAYFLRMSGHAVDVYEKMPKMGGLLRYGIPEYRLPKKVLDNELELLQNMGINFCTNISLDENITIPKLREDYDAVIIAIGAGKSKPMWCKGEDATGVWGGIEFLKEAHNLPDMNGKTCVIVGGSNTAMDAARTALRLGLTAIVSYRRTQAEMPAEQVEIEEAIAEGVQFMFLTAPQEIIVEDGRATGMILQKMELGEPDASGRRSPVPIEGALETIQADIFIAAIGQDVVFDGIAPLENLKVDDNFNTTLAKVYAIGDATGKSWYAIDAMAHGKKVAQLALQDLNAPEEILVQDEKNANDFLHIPKATRQNETSHLQPTSFAETHQTLTPKQAQAEAARCLSCGCSDYGKCKLLELTNIYKAEPKKFPSSSKVKHPIDYRNATIIRDKNKCIHCYLCVNTCKTESDLFSATGRGPEAIVDTAFGQALPTECNQCKKCVNICPTGALNG